MTFQIVLRFLLLVGICLLGLSIAKMRLNAQDKAQPVCRKAAKVVDKEQLSPGTYLPFAEMWILFEIEGEKRIRLNAKAENSIVVGDVGMLTWQGRKILKFERNASDSEKM